ncbi:MAG: M23 family metallopeptidase [Rhodococcus sp.]|uniref:M23 family metallopeptidase n=1 Tax=Rhodococcus sp. TaxID=1831 RepID=UPI0016B66980|nr:M23 family metallopeptidase [Rhodococcus sp. (in: high G+C Gram-positive bacteria)]NLV77783.1 M23 family metallopeptidase [Rhodococcus sp. (in: high G+C Gram-positive bacteria)]
MARHQRTRDEAPAFEIDQAGTPIARGRHRLEPTGTSAPVKAATVAAATGAFFAIGSQFAAGTAAAHPGHDAPVQATPPQTGNLPFELPAGLLPEGVEIPVIPGVTAPAEQGAPQLPVEVADLVQQFTGGNNWLDDLNPVKPSTVQPVSGTLTSDFGQRWGAHHGGIDIAAPIGTPIQSASDGTVVDAGAASGYGQWVRIQNDDGTTAVYGHVDTYQVSAGQRVSAGQQIATVGNRGWSTGPHLHFEVWDQGGAKTDPNAWLNNRGVFADWDINRSL